MPLYQIGYLHNYITYSNQANYGVSSSGEIEDFREILDQGTIELPYALMYNEKVVFSTTTTLVYSYLL
jgi:hypothetical protein